MQISNKHLVTLAAASCVTFGLAGAAHAVSIAYEGFDYDASAALAGQNGGESWRDAWSSGAGTIASGSLAYSNLATTGNSLSISGSIQRRFDETNNGASRISSGTVWISFIGQASSTAGEHLLFFRQDNGFNYFAIGDTNAGGDIGAEWALLGGTDVNGSTGDTVVTDQAFVLVRWDFDPGSNGGDDGQAWLWTNPSLDSEPDIADAEWARTGIPNNNAFLNPAAGVADVRLSTSNQLFFDELRIGRSFAEVTPVPEPTSLGILGLGMLAACRRRRA